MKFVTIAVKALKEIARDKGLLAMTLLFPALFMLAFGTAMRGPGGQNTPYNIVVLNNDRGTELSYTHSEYFNFGENLTQVLKNLKYENSTVPMFKLYNATREGALKLVMNRTVACIVTIPENFSEAIEATINSTVRTAVTSLIGEVAIRFLQGTGGFENTTFPRDGGNFTLRENETMPALPEAENATATVLIEGDLGYMSFGIAQSIIRGVLSGYVDTVRSETRRQILQVVPEEIRPSEELTHVSVETESVSGTREFTAFDYLAPGIIVFGLLMGSIGAAHALARETETQTLSRLKISLMRPFDLLFGTLLPWTLLAGAQVLILFGVALAMGFHWVGGTMSLLIAMLIGCITGVSCVSLGLLVAAFSRSEGNAGNLGMLISVPMSFVIGAFFTIPPEMQAVAVVLPWRHAFLALLSILSFGAQLQDIMFDIEAMIVETAVLFTVGVIAFARIRLKGE